MSEPPPSRFIASQKRKTILERLTAFIFREPENREELLQALQEAHSRNLLDADALSMIEGVLQVSELRARDMMVPRTQADMIDVDEPVESWIGRVIETAHSRFPVYEGDRDHIIGILLAKDLLRYYTEQDFDLRAMLRPVVYIPESKPLNVLLRDFRANRNHMAIVVDEYGSVAGLITIEDVLEQIVGDIEDEYDFDEASDNILPEPGGRFRVKALTQISDFNAAFGTSFSDAEHNTVAGLLIAHRGRLPRRGETHSMGGLRFNVLRADSRRVYTLIVEKPKT